MDRTLVEAGSASGAELVVDFVALTWTELDDCILGAGTVAPIALEAVTAREASASLEQSIRRIQSLRHFAERRRSFIQRDAVLCACGGIGKEPQA